MAENIIDELFNRNRALLAYLLEKDQISFRSDADNNFRKIFLLYIASYFEAELRDALVEFMNEEANELISSFVKNKAIERQYHTYFDWEANNANRFFKLFGSRFSDFMKAEVKKDAKLDTAIKAFLELGQTRNCLVHENSATFPLEKTTEELYELYKKALFFVEIFPQKLRDYSKNNSQK